MQVANVSPHPLQEPSRSTKREPCFKYYLKVKHVSFSQMQINIHFLGYLGRILLRKRREWHKTCGFRGGKSKKVHWIEPLWMSLLRPNGHARCVLYFYMFIMSLYVIICHYMSLYAFFAYLPRTPSTGTPPSLAFHQASFLPGIGHGKRGRFQPMYSCIPHPIPGAPKTRKPCSSMDEGSKKIKVFPGNLQDLSMTFCY